MFKPALPLAALAALGLIATSLPAQTQQTSAFTSYVNEFRLNSVGTSYTVDDMIRGVRDRSRGQRVGNGIVRNFQVSGAPVSSGVGRTPATASIPTVPGASGGGSKPFTSLRRDSTVSPYLNLFNTGIGGSASSFDNYNTLVRPQLRQQSINRQLERQTQQLNARVQQISAQPAFQAQGSDRIMATGHPTVFGYYSRFYPSKGARRR